MIEINGIAHLGIRIANFDRSIGFYRSLGFELTRDDPAEGVVVLSHPSGVVLNLLDSATSDNGNRNILMDEEQLYPGLTHIALQVADIVTAQREITALGLVITEGPVRFGDGSVSIFFRDPDRNVIELTQPQDNTI
ncbi:MAG: glyoxalase [Gammaproteobacteria bacterium]|nr:glyoxalase [Gammaproteobacteria bacterium]